MSAFLRKYATGTGADVYVPIPKRGVVDFAVGADWTPASGDVKISIDGGAAASIGTLPVAVAMGNTSYWKFVFADGELTGKKMIVTVADSATKAVEDQAFCIETYGHASAMYAADLSAANLPVNVIQISGDATAADNAESFFDGTGYAGTNNVIPLVTTLTNLPSITAGWLTATGIASDAITAAKIADGAIDSATFAAGAINAAAIGADAITAGKIADGAIDAATFAAGAINAAAIASNAIDADALAADAVTEIQTGLATAAVVGAIKTQTDQFSFVGGFVNANVKGWADTAAILGDSGFPAVDTVAIGGDSDAASALRWFGLAFQNEAAVDSATSTSVTTALTTGNGYPTGSFPPGSIMFCHTGTGELRWQPILSHNGSTGVFTFAAGNAWATTLDNTSRVVMFPAGSYPQSGDSHAIVNDSAFGNSKLVRSTTPANTFDVSSSGEGGLDFSNVKNATSPLSLTNVTVPNVGVVGSVTGAVGSVTGSVGGNVNGNLGGTISGTGLTAIAAAVWNALTSGFSTSGSIGKRFVDLFAGMTNLAQWLGLIGGKQVGDTTARTELRATGAGSGTFDETTDSQEALSDTKLSSATFTDMTTGSGSNRAFLAGALANAPAGGSGSGDWTNTEKSQIRYQLGIDGTATAPVTNSSHLPRLTITPYVASTSNPRRASRDLAPISQNSAPTDVFVIVNAEGEAIDLTGITVRFVVAQVSDANDADDKTDDELLAKYEYQSGDDANITIAGADNNEISVTHSTTRTAICGKFKYWLWRMDVPVDVAAGSFEVRPATLSA